MEQLALVAGWVVVLFVGFLGIDILWALARGRIDLTFLLAEADGKASFSRFQFLIFTFVIAMCLLVLTLESGQFPEVSLDVLGLLGISGGSYVVSKGIQSGGGSAGRRSGSRPPPPVEGS